MTDAKHETECMLNSIPNDVCSYPGCTCGASTAKPKANYSWNDTISKLTATAKPRQTSDEGSCSECGRDYCACGEKENSLPPSASQPAAALPEDVEKILTEAWEMAPRIARVLEKHLTAQAEALAAKDAEIAAWMNKAADYAEIAESALASGRVLEGALTKIASGEFPTQTAAIDMQGVAATALRGEEG